jgi:SSS family solute:Na+ symporter
MAGVFALAYYTQRFVRGVADYISAGRCAGRYLLTNAGGEAGAGVCNTVANIERFMICGFVLLFWESLILPVGILLMITGFVIYRYRQTRALTLAQFFEERYSRRFRLFIGFIIFASGTFNYAIFPLASTLFFKAFLGLPDQFAVGGMMISTNFAIIASYLTLTLAMICLGGQVSLMITDCVEGLFSHLAYLIIVFVIFSVVSWQQMADVLMGVAPAGASPVATATMAIAPQHSPIDPFDAFQVKDFNFFATMLGLFGTIYLCGAWQAGHGFRSAALTPHEGRMAGILGAWRGTAKMLVLLVIAIGVLTYLRHPDFAERTVHLKERIAAVTSPSGAPVAKISETTPIGSSSWFEGRNLFGATKEAKKLRAADGAEITGESIQRQRQQAPFMALADMLPVGVKGLMLVIMIMGLLAGDGNHIISWSSVFVQDVYMPLRRKPITTLQHLKVLRLGAVGVALIAFVTSLLVPLSTSIWIWWSVTGAIYNGGAGAILIGGLYWTRGTVQAAWAAVGTSLPLSLTAVVLSNNWFSSMTWLKAHGYPEFISSGFWLSFFVSVVAIIVYITVSLLTCRKPFDLQGLLSRAKQHHEQEPAQTSAKQSWFRRLIGLDDHFTRSDRFVATFIFCYSMFMFGLVIFTLFWQYGMPRLVTLFGGTPEAGEALRLTKHGWATIWLWIQMIIPGLIAFGTLIWFSIGGITDMRQFFRVMTARKPEEQDDGTVQH